MERAGLVLDRLEALAREQVGVDDFLALLEDQAAFDPAWSRTEALWSRIQILGQQGRREEALPLLEAEFFRSLHSDNYGARDEAEGVLETLREFGASAERVRPLKQALEEHAPASDVASPKPDVKAPLVRILFVGGDERQVDDGIFLKEQLREEDPRLRVDFFHPGWSGNWGGDLDRLKEKLPDYHGVVVMRFIRTEFGKQLRKAVEVPWVACTGAGRGRMKRSILQAARWARRGVHQ